MALRNTSDNSKIFLISRLSSIQDRQHQSLKTSCTKKIYWAALSPLQYDLMFFVYQSISRLPQPSWEAVSQLHSFHLGIELKIPSKEDAVSRTHKVEGKSMGFS